MKRWILSICFSLMMNGFCWAQNRVDVPSEVKFFYLPHITEQDIGQCFSSDSVLVCPEGTLLPLTFLLKGDVLELFPVESPLQLMIKCTLYLRFHDQQLLMSLDGENWKTWEELFTGMLTASLGIPTENLQLQLQLGAEIFLR